MPITVETHERIDSIAEEWGALAERTGASPFVRAGWIAAWHRCFGHGQLSVLCARRDGAVAAVVPISLARRSLRSPTNWHTPAFGPVGEDSEAIANLLEHLLERRMTRLDLSFLDPAGPGFEQCLRVARQLDSRAVWRIIQRSPYVAITTDWDTYAAGIPARRLSKWRRCRRRLEELGSVSIELERGGERLDAVLAEGFAVEAAGWKGERGTAIISAPETARFYREIAHWAAERGWLRLWFIRLDGRAIAFAYCVEHGRVCYELKTGFDPEYARYGPGVIATRARLEHCFAERLDSYEFLGAPEPHKLDWTSTCRELVRVQVFAPTLAGYADRLAWTHGRRLARRAQALTGRGAHPRAAGSVIY